MALEQKHVFPSEDPRLDWVSKHDDRSQNYRMADKLGAAEIEVKAKRWAPGTTLDQGREGACVGFGWTQEFLSSPRPFTGVHPDRANIYAAGYYHECLANDEYPGEADEGTSVLAGAQTAVRRGLIEEYRWCMSMDEIRNTLMAAAKDGGGPVVIGIPWHYNMYWTDKEGLVDVEGDLVGGHCLLLDEYHPARLFRKQDKRMAVYGWHNSWGNDYGTRGRGYIREEDLRDLLKTWGEACVPIGRKLVRF